VSTIASVRLGADPVNPEIRDTIYRRQHHGQEAIDGLNGRCPGARTRHAGAGQLGRLEPLLFRRGNNLLPINSNQK